MSLSQRLLDLYYANRTLIDDSRASELMLHESLEDVVRDYARPKVEREGGTLEWVPTATLFECQQRFGACVPAEENRRVFMRPDGGIFYAVFGQRRWPILITEDKVQGTNDRLFAEGKKRQSTGNAIERCAKNIRMAEMLFTDMTVFPYVIFAAGCDFHPTETIAKRLEALNYGFSNRTLVVEPAQTSKQLSDSFQDDVLGLIDIGLRRGKCVATIAVKAHKYDELPPGSSSWSKFERFLVCCRVVDLALEAVLTEVLHGEGEEDGEASTPDTCAPSPCPSDCAGSSTP